MWVTRQAASAAARNRTDDQVRRTGHILARPAGSGLVLDLDDSLDHLGRPCLHSTHRPRRETRRSEPPLIALRTQSRRARLRSRRHVSQDATSRRAPHTRDQCPSPLPPPPFSRPSSLSVRMGSLDGRQAGRSSAAAPVSGGRHLRDRGSECRATGQTGRARTATVSRQHVGRVHRARCTGASDTCAE